MLREVRCLPRLIALADASAWAYAKFGIEINWRAAAAQGSVIENILSQLGLDAGCSSLGCLTPRGGDDAVLNALESLAELAVTPIPGTGLALIDLTGTGRIVRRLDDVLSAKAFKPGAKRVLTQEEKRQLARELAYIPHSRPHLSHGTSRHGTKWWEYEDKNGRTMIVVEHTDGSVHVGVPKPQSRHHEHGVEPKYCDSFQLGRVGD